MGAAIGLAVAAEDIRHLERRLHAGCSAGRRRSQTVERAHCAMDRAGCHLRVARRGRQVAVPERPRAIMRTFYVIETEGSAERDPMLAGAARRSVHDTQPCPPP